MDKINKLTNDQIELYEKLSGSKIDSSVAPDEKHQNFYLIINKEGNKKWRSYTDLIQYIKFKTSKDITLNLNEISKRFNAKNFMFKSKEKAKQKSICLTNEQIEKVNASAKLFKISFSNVIGQLIDKNL